MKIATTKERIMKILEVKGDNPADFYRKTGIKRGFLDADKLKSTVNDVFIAMIIASYPDINIEWLISGDGNMLKNEVIQLNDEQSLINTRPRIPLEAAAGALSIAENGVCLEECEQMPIISALPKYDFTIFAQGDSMRPEYHSGDELACLFIRDTKFIQSGRVHVLDTQQGVVVKRVYNEDECFLCKSSNAEYGDFRIHKSEVYNIALVVGLIRRY